MVSTRLHAVPRRRFARRAFLVVASLALGMAALGSLGGCAAGYYWQAARGQMSLLAAREPIEALLADPTVEDELSRRLALARDVRRFAIERLALPDNGSYTTYADVGRPFVVWNVVAAPALALEPREWCYPVVGCVSYRGYFDEADARRHAARLAERGYDAAVFGVPAYSTLGRFADPVLSTMLDRGDIFLASTIIHELAHQVLYVSGDADFSEAFATVVEHRGTVDWLESVAGPAEVEAYLTLESRLEALDALLEQHRARLDAIYSRAGPEAERLEAKAQAFETLRAEYLELRSGWSDGPHFDAWFAGELNNAHLAARATYRTLVPDFQAAFDCSDGFADFYRRVGEIAALDPAARYAALAAAGRCAISADASPPPGSAAAEILGSDQFE